LVIPLIDRYGYLAENYFRSRGGSSIISKPGNERRWAMPILQLFTCEFFFPYPSRSLKWPPELLSVLKTELSS